MALGCVAMLVLFFGLIEALKPTPRLRIELDKNVDLVAMKLDFDGDGKISTSDIIAALAGDESEMMQLEEALAITSVNKNIEINEKSEQIEALKAAYASLEEEAAQVVRDLIQEKNKLEEEAIQVVQEEEETIDNLQKEKDEIANALEEEEEAFDETKALYENALQETLNREEEVEGLLAEAEAEIIQEQMNGGSKEADEKLKGEVEKLKKDKELADAALKDQIAKDEKKIKMLELQQEAHAEVNSKDLKETQQLVKDLVAEKNQEELEMEQMADEIEYLHEKLDKAKKSTRHLRH